MSPEPLPEVGWSFLRKALLTGIAIVLMTAGAVSAAAFLELDSTLDVLDEPGRQPIAAPKDQLDREDAGNARTFLLLGTDERYGDDKLGLKPRSDTMILMRVDPDKKAIAVMSVPRDLLVEIPGYSERQKINSAYTLGGVSLTLKTLRRLLSPYAPGGRFRINHVVTVNFGGFRRAIDYIGCVYADIDRRYFNDNSGGENYATIDVQPGYQKICGQDALDYVRYRHNDNDLVRAARQQDFLRQVQGQDSIKALTDFSKRKDILRIFRRYFSYDASLKERKTVLSVLKLLLFSANREIQEVQFRVDLTKADESYLHTNPELLERTVKEFFAAETSSAPRARAKTEDKEFKKSSRKRKRNKPSTIPGLEVARQEGENMAVLKGNKVDFPFYFPTLRTRNSRYALQEPRTYSIRDGDGKLHRAYRLVLYNGRFGEYYGVQGTTWRNPPILDNPSAEVRRDGRRLKVYRTGKKVRLVAWRTEKAVYWVSNSLNQALSSREMIGIAASLRRLGQK